MIEKGKEEAVGKFRKTYVAFAAVSDRCFFALFKFAAKIIFRKKRRILIVDIDNTIAHTWPSHTYKYDSYSQKYSSIAVLWKVFQQVREYQKKKDCIIFLSARAFYLYFITRTWLQSSGMKVDLLQLFLVTSARKKINFLRYASKIGLEVTYLDDLSGNHESGEVCLYSDIIDEVRCIKGVKYLGYDFINSLTCKAPD